MSDIKHISNLPPKTKAVVIGAAIGVISMAIALIVFAELNTMLMLPEFFIGALSLTTIALGSFFGGIFGGKCARENGMLVGFLIGIVLSIILAISSVSIFEQAISFFSILKIALTLIFCVAGGIFGVNSKSNRRR